MLRRLQKLLCMVLVVLLVVSMASPALAKSVKAKVKTSSAKFYSRASTSSASVSIKKGTALTVTAVKSGWAKVKCGKVTGYMKTSALSSADKASSNSASGDKSWKSKVVAIKWFDGGSHVLKKGHYGYIYDIKSGYTIKIYRMGGVNHADIEPATAADAQKLKKLGSSWDPRPVILSAGGKYVAASINTKAHGDQTITTNGYDGQICLHMVGSKTHGGDAVRADHQECILKAYKWAHG